jgi:hypothetical protein
LLTFRLSARRSSSRYFAHGAVPYQLPGAPNETYIPSADRCSCRCCLPVLAQTNTPKVDQRQANQQQRIDQGVASGQLTGKEAARLEKGQAQVEKKEAKAKADGKVTAKERAKHEQAQNQQSKKIKHEKHDSQRDLDHDGKKDRPGARSKLFPLPQKPAPRGLFYVRGAQRGRYPRRDKVLRCGDRCRRCRPPVG